MTTAVNRLPAPPSGESRGGAQAGLSAELTALLCDDLPMHSSPEAITTFPEEAQQLGLLMYVVSVILPTIGTRIS